MIQVEEVVHSDLESKRGKEIIDDHSMWIQTPSDISRHGEVESM